MEWTVVLEYPHHRIVAADVDVAVVEEEGIRQGGQAFARLLVVSGDGFLGEVAAGHDKRQEGSKVEGRRSGAAKRR